MAFNSSWLRDILKQRCQDPVAVARRVPHRNVMLREGNKTAEDEIAISGRLNFLFPTVPDEGFLAGLPVSVIVNGFDAIKVDFSAFLVKAGMIAGEGASQRFRFCFTDLTGISEPQISDPYVVRSSARCFTIHVSEGEICIESSSLEGFWNAIVYMERTMATCGHASLPRGTIQKKPALGIQISQPPYGVNYLVPDLSPDFVPDDAFTLLVHYGINGMLIYGDMGGYVHSAIFPELNAPEPEQAENVRALQDATERAAARGVSLYWVCVSPKLAGNHLIFQRCPGARGAVMGDTIGQETVTLCTSDPDPDVLAFHAEFMNLFLAFPSSWR